MVVLVVLYILSAALPVLGLVRIWLHARSEVRKYEGLAVVHSTGVIAKNQMRAIQWDFLWIGIGVSCGAIAGIWSLFI